MPYACQDQAGAPAFCEVQPQCSSGIEELQISTDQGEQVIEKESWWSCPWCDFRIDSEPKSRSDAKPCRWRAKHLLNEHPQKNHDAPEAKVTTKGKDERMRKIQESTIMNIQKAIDLYNGPHEFEASPNSMRCIWCDWTGKPRDMPEMCNPLQRGGLRINVQTMDAVKVAGDGLCLWASLAHFSELNKYEFRQQV